MAGRHASRNRWSSASLEPVVLEPGLVAGGVVGRVDRGEHRREVEARPPSSGRWPRSPRAGRSGRPPRRSSAGRATARCSRTSSAMYSKKVVTNSGRPVKRLRSSGFWVAMPTGQVSRWQTRIMMQPDTTSGAVAKPNSSAPSSAATTTSRPVFSCPSTWTTMRSRRPFMSRVCWVSARPSSQGIPACLSEVIGAAPVPPSCPEMSTTSEWALATPAATVPTPDLGDQLHVDPGPRVGRLQVVDELGDVLDRVDVVVRRRRDEPDPGRREPGPRDPRVDLGPRELATLARAWPPGRS